MKGEGGDYLISLRKEGSHRSRSIVRVALIAPDVRCKSRYCGLTHFRQSSFPPHVDPQQMSVVPQLFLPHVTLKHINIIRNTPGTTRD